MSMNVIYARKRESCSRIEEYIVLLFEFHRPIMSTFGKIVDS